MVMVDSRRRRGIKRRQRPFDRQDNREEGRLLVHGQDKRATGRLIPAPRQHRPTKRHQPRPMAQATRPGDNCSVTVARMRR